jgi:hypothetical protein
MRNWQSSASQQILRILCNRNVLTMFTGARQRTLSWTLQNNPHLIFWRTALNVTLPSMPRSSKWSLPLRLPSENFSCIISRMRATCHAHFILIYFIFNNIFGTIQIMELLNASYGVCNMLLNITGWLEWNGTQTSKNSNSAVHFSSRLILVTEIQSQYF